MKKIPQNTRKFRLEIYKEVLKQDDYRWGLCCEIRDIIKNKYSVNPKETLIDPFTYNKTAKSCLLYYPELYNRRTIRDNIVQLFNNYEERKQALKAAIKELEK